MNKKDASNFIQDCIMTEIHRMCKAKVIIQECAWSTPTKQREVCKVYFYECNLVVGFNLTDTVDEIHLKLYRNDCFNQGTWEIVGKAMAQDWVRTEMKKCIENKLFNDLGEWNE